jgi:drug/metabolite transporter (DMT)-like permease
MTLACLRVGIALVVLLPLATRSGTRPSRDLGTCLMGLTGVCLFCLFQNLGLVFTTAANTALINGGIPVLTALLAATFIGEHLTRWQVTGLFLSLAGVAVIVCRGTSGVVMAGPDSLLPLASAVSFAAYAVVGRRTFRADNTLAVVAGSTRYGFLFLLPGAGIELATMGMRPLSVSSTVLLLYLGVGCSALAFVLCGYGLAHLDAGQGAVFGNLKPIVGIVLAVMLLGESLTTGQVVGGGLVLLGVVLASRTSLARHRPVDLSRLGR